MIFLFVTSSYAVGQCKSEKDEFTGVSTITGIKHIDLKRSTSLSVRTANEFKFTKLNDGSIFLSIELNVGAVVERKLLKSEPVLFKLSDDSVIKVYPESDVDPTKNLHLGYTPTSTYLIKMRLSEQDLKSFSRASLSAIRFTIGDNYDYEPHGMQKNALKKVAQCMLKN
ncbi:MAG: hypothetical protein AAFX87_20240 [Bacteroidota bacterium]